ncbi:dynamin family protein [Goodfellowiella coeruleoviolacea]|uniref:Dynamin family protein n=1 Tax=Goodfellowiella coeruleoviolacea TaxID=334858 RepID=A0AAE3GEY9_9PSEU|nr:dynamin family protein [Goodfellowiella coeruleoviolacea]MCP2167036.1 Dynamin family protein [Goodfellowiella coeruleoviolacea]
MRPGDTLDERAWALLTAATRVYQDSPRALGWLRHHLARFAEPLRVAVVGMPGSGKSTVVNALVGEEIAPVELGEHGQVPTWYQAGGQPRAQVFSASAPPRDLPVARVDRQLDIDTEQWPAGGARPTRLVVDWPARSLRDTTLIDTPPLTPPGASEVDPPGPGAVTAEQLAGEADAVLYLMRHMHGRDLRLLQAMHDHPIAGAAPVSTILVLSRADEIGASRIDALSSAKRIARRYRRDVQVTAVCQNVVALAGLIASAGRTLRETELAALTALARVPREELERFLLSTDRFTAADFPVALDAPSRRALLDRFGIFGVRLSTTLIRQGFDTHPKLAAQLVQRSGLAELRDAVGAQFTERRAVLKARSALLALDVVLRREPRPAARALAADLERLLAGAHEFRELRLLAALQSGGTTLPGELDAEAQRLIGGDGPRLAARLGVDAEADDHELYRAALDALARWQRQADNPLLTPTQRRAAQVVVRSCEGALAALTAPA